MNPVKLFLYWIIWGKKFWNSFSTNALHPTESCSPVTGEPLLMRAEDLVVLFWCLVLCSSQDIVVAEKHFELLPTLWKPIHIVLPYYLNIDGAFSTWPMEILEVGVKYLTNSRQNEEVLKNNCVVDGFNAPFPFHICCLETIMSSTLLLLV